MSQRCIYIHYGTRLFELIFIVFAFTAHTYTVSVRTGDMYGAGTDASVFLTIYGDLGDTGERKLAKSENSKNKFERGAVGKGPIHDVRCLLVGKAFKACFTVSASQVDKFSIEAVDLGQVFKIHIRHDNSMIGADWYLDQVEVLDVDTEEVYMFLCERWLSTKREDKRIGRTFYVKVGGKVTTFYSTAVRKEAHLYVCSEVEFRELMSSGAGGK